MILIRTRPSNSTIGLNIVIIDRNENVGKWGGEAT